MNLWDGPLGKIQTMKQRGIWACKVSKVYLCCKGFSLGEQVGKGASGHLKLFDSETERAPAVYNNNTHISKGNFKPRLVIG